MSTYCVYIFYIFYILFELISKHRTIYVKERLVLVNVFGLLYSCHFNHKAGATRQIHAKRRTAQSPHDDPYSPTQTRHKTPSSCCFEVEHAPCHTTYTQTHNKSWASCLAQAKQTYYCVTVVIQHHRRGPDFLLPLIQHHHHTKDE